MKALLNLLRQFKLETYTLLILMNLLLAIFAFFKDVAFAHYFGTSGTADAYTLGFFIPDMIGNNLLASALGVTCIPIFSRLLIRGQKTLFVRVVQRIGLIIFILTLFLSVGLFLSSHWIISWYGHDLSDVTKLQALRLFREMVPIVFLIPLTFIGVAFLQTDKKFMVPAIAPIVYHLMLLCILILISMLGLRVEQGGTLYGWATTLATLIYFFFVWIRVLNQWWRDQVNPKPLGHYKVTPYLMALFKDIAPYLLILAFTQALLSVERYYASSLESGTLAALNYAYRLVEFPISVFVAAITTVLLPDFSRELSAKRPLTVMKQMKRALAVTVALTLICSFGLFILRHLIVSMLFERGAFNAHSVLQTTTILAGYSFAIVGQSISLICLRYYIASRKMTFPLLVYFFGTFVSILIDYLFVPRYGAVALGLAGSIGAILSGVLFILGVARENKFYKAQAMGKC